MQNTWIKCQDIHNFFYTLSIMCSILRWHKWVRFGHILYQTERIHFEKFKFSMDEPLCRLPISGSELELIGQHKWFMGGGKNVGLIYWNIQMGSWCVALVICFRSSYWIQILRGFDFEKSYLSFISWNFNGHVSSLAKLCFVTTLFEFECFQIGYLKIILVRRCCFFP